MSKPFEGNVQFQDQLRRKIPFRFLQIIFRLLENALKVFDILEAGEVKGDNRTVLRMDYSFLIDHFIYKKTLPEARLHEN